jgi:hypothetical protein
VVIKEWPVTNRMEYKVIQSIKNNQELIVVMAIIAGFIVLALSLSGRA